MPARHVFASLTLVLAVTVTVAAAPVRAGELGPGGAPAARVDDRTHDGFFLPTEGAADDGRDTSDLRYPEAPLEAYRPRFVRQTGKNCAFASAAMLLDKWTRGALRPSQARLRAASRVPDTEGVNFAALSRAVARVTDVDLRYSPNGGDPLTWPALLSRLARGGGAVVGGAYSRLPRHYQRWGREFASRGASASGHAVYVERYEPTRAGGRVWMMDPLAKSARYSGEWISVRELRRYAWLNSRGLVTAAATPEPPPLAGYQFGRPQVGEWSLAGQPTQLRLPVTIAAGWSAPAGLAAVVEWQLIEPEPEITTLLADLDKDLTASTTDDPAGAADGISGPDLGPQLAATLGPADDPGTSPADAGAGGDGEAAALVELAFRDGLLVGEVDAPAEAGVYELSVELRLRNGAAPAGAGQSPITPATVRLHGALAADMTLLSEPSATKGMPLGVGLLVANRGTRDWSGDDGAIVVATWQTPLGTLAGATAVVELAAGTERTVTLNAVAPALVDGGELVVELWTEEGFPLSPFGAEPLVVPLLFADPLGK